MARSSNGNTSDFESYRSGIFGCLTNSGSIPRVYDFLASIRQNLTDFVIFLIPSFIYSWFAGTVTKATLSPTAWLDGLRGIACVAVVIHHYAYGY